MTLAIAAFGVVLQREGVTVAEVIDFPGYKYEKGFIDVTNHDSAGGFEESIIKKIIRTGEITVKCNRVIGDAAQEGIKADCVAGTASTYSLAFPDGEAIGGDAKILSYEIQTPLDEQMTFTFVMKWTGAITDAVTATNNISALTITTGTAYPAFAAATYDYTVTSVGNTCTFTATFAAGTAKLYREGVYVQDLLTTVESGSINLGDDGTMTDITITVQETGKSLVTYNFHVANAAA